MKHQRTDRLNSLLREVISDIIRKEVKHPKVAELFSITRVDITRDLRHAKVYVSVIGAEGLKEETVGALNQSSDFIAVKASKQVVMRYFPELHFKVDDSADKHMRIDTLIQEIQQEREQRPDSDVD